MEIWIGLAILAVLAGLGLTAYALVRVSAGLRNTERQRQVREGRESLFLETKLRDFAAAQSEIAGRFFQAIESPAKSQSELQRAVAERLETLDKRLGDNLRETSAKTAATLGGLQERLVATDVAHANAGHLYGEVVAHQQIATHQSARGVAGD